MHYKKELNFLSEDSFVQSLSVGRNINDCVSSINHYTVERPIDYLREDDNYVN